MEKDHIRLAVGIIGNVTSLLLYGAPVLTFMKVIKEKSVGQYSCTPYLIALFNCLVYTWYGFPVVSNGWENFLVSTVNGVGIVPECFAICTYIVYALPKFKRKVARMVGCVLVLFGVMAAISFFSLHDHKNRKFMIGIVGILSSISLYSAPFVAMKLVIQTKSVEFMPFHLSFFAFINCIMWMTYGALSRDIFLATPNVIGCPLALAQLVLYCIYRKKTRGVQNGNNLDPEKGVQINGAQSTNSEEKTKLPDGQKVENAEDINATEIKTILIN